MLNKSSGTNILAAICVGLGYILPDPFRQPVFHMGLFALSGALTNWLAVHMLFEKVPGLYGSGIIPSHFEEFKAGIHQLVMEQFFSEDNMERFLQDSAASSSSALDIADLISDVDMSPAFDSLVGAIKESSFGGMLGMLGGDAALEPLKEPFSLKLKASIVFISQSPSFQEALNRQLHEHAHHSELQSKVQEIVHKRLDELTPQMVKEIIRAPTPVVKGERQKLDHIGFIINEQAAVDEWFAFLKSNGVTMLTEPRTHRDGARSFYCEDPDGTMVQLIWHPPISGLVFRDNS